MLALTLVAIAAPCPTPGAGETALSAAADSLSPGQWCEVDLGQTNTDFASDGICTTHGPWLQYLGGSMWDPIERNLVVIGGAHTGSFQECNDLGTTTYNEPSHTWYKEVGGPSNTNDSSGTHGWDNSVVDPATGTIYHHQSVSYNFRYANWNGTGYGVPWPQMTESISECDSRHDQNGAFGVGWDNTPGKDGLAVLYNESDQSWICHWDRQTDTWTKVYNTGGNTLWGSYTQIVSCNHLSHRCVFLGYYRDTSMRGEWNGDTYELVANAPAPVSFYFAVAIVADSASDKFIIGNWDNGGMVWRDWDGADSWRTFGEGELAGFEGPPLSGDTIDGCGATDGGGNMTAASVSTYGIVLFVDWACRGANIYAYKHALSTPDDTAPAAPTNLQAQ